MLEMMDDLNEVVRVLDFDIATEEVRSRAANSDHPTLVRALASRRDKLRETICLLEKRLANIQGPQH